MSFAFVAAGTVALGTAGSIYSGNKANKAQNRATQIADSELALARDQFAYQRDLANRELNYTDLIRKQSDPTRRLTLAHTQNFLDGGGLPRGLVPDYQPYTQPIPRQYTDVLETGALPTGLLPAPVPFDVNFAGARDTAEAQYQVARRNVLERADVRGGTLGTALAQVEAARARTLTEQAQQQDLLRQEAQERYTYGLEAPARRALVGEALQATQQAPVLERQAQERYQYGVEAPTRAALFGRATEIATGQPTQQFAGLQGAAAISSANAPTFGQAGQLTATVAGQQATQATAAGQSTGSAAALAAYLKKQRQAGGAGVQGGGVPLGVGAGASGGGYGF